MIDEKKIEEAAIKHISSNEYSSYNSGEIEDEMILCKAKNSFKAGIDWLLDNIKHNPKEKPKVGEKVIVQLYKDGSWHSAFFNGYDFDVDDMDEEGEYSAQLLEITRWLYIEDLMRGGK